MLGSIRSRLAFSLALFALSFPSLAADPPATPCWNVDELKVGQRGYGVTVMKGVTREKFDAEVLGVLKNTSPGRDMVLCRLSGLNLERTGVIAGMGGSPVYIEGKLLGAVAYAWAYGKEPIAGVTPFSQMRSFADSFERHSVSTKSQSVRIGLSQPVQAAGQSYTSVTVSANPTGPKLDSDESLCMVPLRAPLAASGFSSNSLRMLREQFPDLGISPVMIGSWI